MLQGREFTPTDTSDKPRVAVIDTALMRKYLPGQDPVGEHIRMNFGSEPAIDYEIVGVVENVRHTTLKEEPTARLYAPLFQIPKATFSISCKQHEPRRSLLFSSTLQDANMLFPVSLILIVVSAVARWIPAYRAAKTNPLLILHSQ